MSDTVLDALNKLLADTFVLYMETHSFHWNVTGPNFYGLHMLWETQYNELWTATDVLAERIRTLGHKAPGTFAAFLALSSLEEPAGDLNAEQMIAKLLADNKALADSAQAVLDLAGQQGDEASAAIASERLVVHQKAAWMLQSLLA